MNFMTDEIFEHYEVEIDHWLRSADFQLAIPLDAGSAGSALRNYLVLTHRPEFAVWQPTESESLCGRYYWFLLAIRSWQKIYGYDAGMEQQALQLLETINAEVDWEAIQTIERKVDEEVGKLHD